MSSTRFRGHVITCTVCSHQSRAETLLVAKQKDAAHAVKCDARAKLKANAEAARVAQGEMLGGGE